MSVVKAFFLRLYLNLELALESWTKSGEDCVSVRLIINCFSSRFIMARGESTRRRTFLELRLQSVSNFLATVTSICADVQLFGGLKKTETDPDGSSSSSGGERGCRERLNLDDQSCSILHSLYPEKKNLLMEKWLR